MDKRIEKTHAAIKSAFEDLVMANPGKRISVSELTQKANINRKTFYLHYDSIDDLWQSYVDEISDDLFSRLTARPSDVYLRERGLLLTVFADFFSSNRKFASFLLTSNEYGGLISQILRQVAGAMAKVLQRERHYTADDALMIATFSVNNMVAMLRLQLNGDTHMPPEEARKKILALTLDGLKGMGLEIPD
ncbi:TetR/AcrR family transcriptional regulator [Lacticaseibacillus saniviri]